MREQISSDMTQMSIFDIQSDVSMPGNYEIQPSEQSLVDFACSPTPESEALEQTPDKERARLILDVIPGIASSSGRTLKERQSEFRRTLAHACGSEEFYVHGGPWAVPITLTEGMHFVVENGGRSDRRTAYWLADIIASYQGEAQLLRMDIQFWKLELVLKDGSIRGGVVTCGNGNGKEIVRQELDYCDFILDEGIELYVGWNYVEDPRSKTGYKKIRTILLPSEY
jgi:hypothetical protein